MAARSSVLRRSSALPDRTTLCRRTGSSAGAFVWRELYRLTPLLLYNLPPKGAENENDKIHLFTIQWIRMADRKRHEELVVITKTYDLILWSCNHTGKFPRNHRFVLGERIERMMANHGRF